MSSVQGTNSRDIPARMAANDFARSILQEHTDRVGEMVSSLLPSLIKQNRHRLGSLKGGDTIGASFSELKVFYFCDNGLDIFRSAYVRIQSINQLNQGSRVVVSTFLPTAATHNQPSHGFPTDASHVHTAGKNSQPCIRLITYDSSDGQCNPADHVGDIECGSSFL